MNQTQEDKVPSPNGRSGPTGRVPEKSVEKLEEQVSECEVWRTRSVPEEIWILVLDGVTTREVEI